MERKADNTLARSSYYCHKGFLVGPMDCVWDKSEKCSSGGDLVHLGYSNRK